MAHPPGSKLGSYEVLSLIGAGGMGEVYRARDTRLGREVAIKVLPAERLGDQDRRRRFVQEAQAASSLNHPHIITIHEIESANGNDFIVMEYVRGKSLDTLIPRQGMRLGEALRIAIPVADALAAAHAHGIIHRDLKPANVMVGSEGAVKVLDFGLAKLTGRDEPSPDVETFTEVRAMDLSVPGTIVGTAAYMSPEQATGGAVDARTDIFSFGALLYEMVTGARAFAGPSTADTLAAVIRAQPTLPAAIVPGLPTDLEKIILRCLRKDRDRRFQHIADVKVALEDVKEDTESGTVVALTRPRHGRLLATLGGLVIVTAIAAVWALRSGRAVDTPAPRVVPLTTLTGMEMATTFSPDGDQVAFVWNGENQDNFDIYVKMIGSAEVRRLTTAPGFDAWPAWSPDGRQIAYVRDPQMAGSQIRLMTSLGGSDRKLSDLPGLRRVAWSPDSRYIAAGVHGSEQAVKGDTRERNGIYLIPVAGGEPRPITTPKAPGSDQAPSFSPDGRRLAYAACRGTTFRTNCDVHVLDVDASFSATAPSRRLTQQASFDISSLAWSRDGTSIIYHARDTGMLHYLWRVRADGDSPPERIEMAGLNSAWPATVPSRDRLAFTRVLNDIDIYQFQPGSSPRALLSSSLQDSNPQVSPDGRRIAFCSNRSGEAMEVWVAAADGTGAEQLTHGPGRWQGSPHWSPDGRQIAFDSQAEDGRRHIWAIDADGGTPRQITRDEGDQIIPTWSRDGHWIYFSWAQGAVRDIWRIQAAGGAKQRITSDGGGWVGHESPDGKSLLYAHLIRDKWSLLAVPLTGGPSRQVLACVDGTAFVVGSESLYYVACGSGEAEVHVRNWATGDDRLLGTLEKYERNWVPSSFSVAPDASVVLFHRTIRGGTDLMLIENFR